jgi:hypothetical protein
MINPMISPRTRIPWSRAKIQTTAVWRAEIIMIGGQVKGQVLTAHVLEQRLRGRVEVHPRPVHALRSRVGCANVHAVSIRVWISARTS